MTRPEDVLPSASEAHGTPDKATATLRAAEIARLRGRRWTYARIAEHLGYSDRAAPRRLLQEYANRLLADNVSEMRATWNETHELQAQRMVKLVTSGNTTPEQKVRASAELTRIGARVARLNGMDAPIQVAVTAGLSSELDDALAELREAALGDDVVDAVVVEDPAELAGPAEPSWDTAP